MVSTPDVATTVELAVWEALAGVRDPEIPPLSITDLGIVKDVRVSDLTQLEQDVTAEIKARRMSPQESHRKFAHMGFGVPERVRAVLTEPQRKTLEGMLGEPHDFNP